MADSKPRAVLQPITCKSARNKLALAIDGIRTCDISIDSADQHDRAHLIRRAVNSHDRLLMALKTLIRENPAFRSKPIGAPHSPARLQQQDAIEAEDFALKVIAEAEGRL